MRTRNSGSTNGAMLDLWRTPHGAGDPVGCLATTYTFAPGLFDEQCLARFLEIDSEPNREDLAFLLERESRLGGVYAGVLVDYTQAGVEHSLRWDVLPVRIRAGKQHAKLSVLAWTGHVRIIVASANLSEQGYRSNHEIAAAIDVRPDEANHDVVVAAVAFLRRLIMLVPGAAERPADVRRAVGFLDDVERRVRDWEPIRRRGSVRQHLVFTMPATTDGPASSSLDDAIGECRKRGGSPDRVRIASPFFDGDGETSAVTATLCKLMARGVERKLRFGVPSVPDEGTTVPRLAAPKSLFRTPERYEGAVTIEILPVLDADKNPRPWHAKMASFRTAAYSALMIGSSNFTSAGMGVGSRRNAEANLLTIADEVDYAREAGKLEAVWPEMDAVDDPERAEWLGARSEDEEEEEASKSPPLPAGFLAATYRAGDSRVVVLRVEPPALPADWRIHSCGRQVQELLSATTWRDGGSKAVIEIPWEAVLPPEKLRVTWEDHEAFLPLNVEDSRALPPPPQLEKMSADDMLRILAASDPSAAIRAWVAGKAKSDLFDSDLDSAVPIDLDPLRRYDLQATFLHRIRRRARVLAQLRSNLERPVWGHQALEWRLTGIVGVQELANRLLREWTVANGGADEALLTLTDFLIVLREVDYQPSDGSLSRKDFDNVYRPFLIGLADRVARRIDEHRPRMSGEMREFWDRVVTRCRE